MNTTTIASPIRREPELLFMPTPQAPIGSGFGAASTAAEVIAGRDLTGKTAVVTGGYSGIGVETVRAFRSAGDY